MSSSSVGCNLCFKLGLKGPGWDRYLNNVENIQTKKTIIIIFIIRIKNSTILTWGWDTMYTASARVSETFCQLPNTTSAITFHPTMLPVLGPSRTSTTGQ